ncbi:MAG TPA: efflux transporter outer membrane subunit [Myxococcota bacterium]|nr:efflux transporter outer membrane subunit [Myxococcota bacterium]
MRRAPRVIWAAAAVGAWLCGCAVGPDYQRPALDVPDAYHEPAAAGAPALEAEWWKLFSDPELVALEEQARVSNTEVQAAIARIDEARATARIARADFFPTLTLDPSYTVGRVSLNRQPAPRLGHFEDVDVPFDLSYEIDVFGRVRRNFESATASAYASERDYEAVWLALAAQVAAEYFAIRSLDAQAAVLERSRDVFEEQVRVVSARRKAGLVSDLDVAQAETQLASTVGQQADVTRLRAETEHALAVLVGRPAPSFAVPVRPLDTVAPEVPAGVPSDLLQHRPDVVEAEYRLAAANAEIGVAKALLFPQVRLTGAAGWESASFSDVVNWESRLWEIGPSIHVPIFEGGRLRANLSAAEARWAESVQLYRGTVLGAFRDVEDALAGVRLRADQDAAVRDAVEASGRAAAVARAQYDRGIADYLQVAVAEATHLNLELQSAQISEQRLDASLQLVKAIGGSWR